MQRFEAICKSSPDPHQPSKDFLEHPPPRKLLTTRLRLTIQEVRYVLICPQLHNTWFL
jgi:hypothetical protein